MQILQIRGGISASFLKTRKFKFSKILLLPLSEITKISERKLKAVKIGIYQKGVCNWINSF